MTEAADANPLERAPRAGSAGRPRAGRLIAALLALLLVAAAGGFLWVGWRLPIARTLEPPPSPALVLLDAEGRPFARKGAYKEAPVDAARLPAHVTGAFIAIEDRRFHRHHGLDLRGIARAALANRKAGRVVEGGSTITQQLAKMTFLTPERSFRRKAQEAVIAIWLELRLDKDEILSRYLSNAYFGDAAYGLGAASRHYFDKPPEQLAVGEAAMLAGLVKAPSQLNPVDHPRAAEARARTVLTAMAEAGVLTPEAAAATPPPKVRSTRAALPVGGYFADWVSPQLRQAFAAPGFGERRVATTLDLDLQRRAERAVRRNLAAHGARARAGQAALVAMRPDGRVVAMVGGTSYRQSQFNRAVQARRQPGSAFKLAVYLAAIRDGASPDMVVSDEPVAIGDWSPRNFDGAGGGYLTLRDAFARSSNVAAVRVAQTAGEAALAQAASDLGFLGPLPADDPTVALGTAETTLLELTAAYAAVAADRAPVRPYGVAAGEAAASGPDPLTAYERDLLRDLLQASVDYGTGRAAQLVQPVYGKTGTTQDHRDAVFVGFTGDMVIGVWVGNDDHSPMSGVTGGGLPARIWRDFAAGALEAGDIRRVRPEPRLPDPLEALQDQGPRRGGFGEWLRRLFGGG